MTSSPAQHHHQAGLSVVELMIAVAITGVAISVFLAVLTSVQRVSAESDRRGDSLNEARVMMAVLTKDLGATLSVVAIAGRSDVTVLASTAGAGQDGARTIVPNRIRLYIDPRGRLVEEVTAPDNPAADPLTFTGPVRRRVVGTSVTSSSELFTFYEDANPPVVTSNPGRAASVWVSLAALTPGPGSVAPARLLQWVWMRPTPAENPPPPPPDPSVPTTAPGPTTPTTAPTTTAPVDDGGATTTTTKPPSSTTGGATSSKPPSTTAPGPTTTKPPSSTTTTVPVTIPR